MSTPMCITPSALSTTSTEIAHLSTDHDASRKQWSTSTEHAKSSVDLSVQSAQVKMSPSNFTHLTTPMVTTSSVTTTRNALKAIAAVTFKQ